MFENLQKIEKIINSELASKVQQSVIINEELTVEVNVNDLIEVVQFLKSNDKCKFRQLIDIAGVDYPEKDKRFQLVYLFLSHENNVRIKILIKFQTNELINSLTKNSDWLAITTLNIFERENLEGIEIIKLDELFIPYTKYLIFNKGNENNNLKNFNKLLELLIELSSKSIDEVQESILRKDIHHNNNLTYKDNFLPFQKIYLNNIDRNNKINLNVKIGVQHDTIQTSFHDLNQ